MKRRSGLKYTHAGSIDDRFTEKVHRCSIGEGHPMLISKNEADALDITAADPAFRSDVLECFASSRRAIPARWLYDRTGSELFEAITELPEYYPSRTERNILAEHASEIAVLTGTGRVVVEFGSGSSVKTPLLLSAVAPSAYLPIDISGDFLRESAETLKNAFPSLPVHAVEADFMQPLLLPAVIDAPRLGFFPGSTIGNMVAGSAVDMLRAFAATLGCGAQLLVGIDRIKSPAILIPAYDDAMGVTARFNLNLLLRINRELDGTIPAERFSHVARWNDAEARIEMHLESQEDVEFKVCGIDFRMAAGETIHTENSFKYGPRDARLLLHAGGWTPIGEWVDEKDMFAVILAKATPFATAP